MCCWMPAVENGGVRIRCLSYVPSTAALDSIGGDHKGDTLRLMAKKTLSMAPSGKKRHETQPRRPGSYLPYCTCGAADSIDAILGSATAQTLVHGLWSR